MTARQDIEYRKERSTAVMKWSLARRSTADSKGDNDHKGWSFATLERYADSEYIDFGVQKGWEDGRGQPWTRSSSKRFEDQVAVGGGKWQGHGGDDAEQQCLSTSCATTGFLAPRTHGELLRAPGAACRGHCARSLRTLPYLDDQGS